MKQKIINKILYIIFYVNFIISYIICSISSNYIEVLTNNVCGYKLINSDSSFFRVLLNIFGLKNEPKGITLFPVIIIISKDICSFQDQKMIRLIRHECTHIKQYYKNYVLLFYVKYLYQYIKNFIVYKDSYIAYSMIDFEIEAREAENDDTTV